MCFATTANPAPTIARKKKKLTNKQESEGGWEHLSLRVEQRAQRAVGKEAGGEGIWAGSPDPTQNKAVKAPLCQGKHLPLPIFLYGSPARATRETLAWSGLGKSSEQKTGNGPETGCRVCFGVQERGSEAPTHNQGSGTG